MVVADYYTDIFKEVYNYKSLIILALYNTTLSHFCAHSTAA